MDAIEQIKDFFNNIKTLFTDFFNYLPNELAGMIIPIILILIIIFIYKFLR